uniref:non-specific serine/threonine protein kinase n=1 Tax=Tanacetum cinerariifolium TaxID=118510 RepID=A0A6L2KED0_TANCI|nr:CBL-interacting serine/threonine-protein kinase 1-like [Tanacetum cinerariifolium]
MKLLKFSRAEDMMELHQICGHGMWCYFIRDPYGGCIDSQMVPLGAKNLINRIHDPNEKTRITMADIKTEEWFKQDYTSAAYEEEEEEVLIDDEVLSLHETPMDSDKDPQSPTHINAFELIGMSSSLDISGLIEKEAFGAHVFYHVKWTNSHILQRELRSNAFEFGGYKWGGGYNRLCKPTT